MWCLFALQSLIHLNEVAFIHIFCVLFICLFIHGTKLMIHLMIIYMTILLFMCLFPIHFLWFLVDNMHKKQQVFLLLRLIPVNHSCDLSELLCLFVLQPYFVVWIDVNPSEVIKRMTQVYINSIMNDTPVLSLSIWIATLENRLLLHNWDNTDVAAAPR